jgi:hypothetical protein
MAKIETADVIDDTSLQDGGKDASRLPSGNRSAGGYNFQWCFRSGHSTAPKIGEACGTELVTAERRQLKSALN